MPTENEPNDPDWLIDAEVRVERYALELVELMTFAAGAARTMIRLAEAGFDRGLLVDHMTR